MLKKVIISFFSMSLLLVNLSLGAALVSVGGGDVSGGGGDVSGGGGDVSGGGDEGSGGNDVAGTKNGQRKSPPIQTYNHFHQNLVGLRGLLDMGFDGAGSAVVVIDTGVSPTFRGLHKVIAFHDLVGKCTLENVCDGHSHGTAVADVVHQAAPGANLIIIRALRSNGHGDSGDLDEAMNWVWRYKKKYNIVAVNLSVSADDSYSGYPVSGGQMKIVAQKLVDAGISVVSLSGNEDQTLVRTMPVNIPDVLTVGSFSHRFTLSDLSAHTISSFTNFGWAVMTDANCKNRMFVKSCSIVTKSSPKPEVLAPGESILAQVEIGTKIYEINKKLQDRVDRGEILRSKYYLLDGDKTFLSGSSFAAPLVSGGIAVLRQALPSVEAKEIKQALMRTSSGPTYVIDKNTTDGSFKIGTDKSVTIGAVNFFDAYQNLKAIREEKAAHKH